MKSQNDHDDLAYFENRNQRGIYMTAASQKIRIDILKTQVCT